MSYTRLALRHYNKVLLQAHLHIYQLVQDCLQDDPVQFLLDYSIMANVITAVQAKFSLFKMTNFGLFKDII